MAGKEPARARTPHRRRPSTRKRIALEAPRVVAANRSRCFRPPPEPGAGVFFHQIAVGKLQTQRQLPYHVQFVKKLSSPLSTASFGTLKPIVS